jgi:hypothetical protein
MSLADTRNSQTGRSTSESSAAATRPAADEEADVTVAYRELDGALGLSAIGGDMLADSRTGRNGRHALVGMLWQSVFGRLAGYEDVNHAERLRHDPAMRWIVGDGNLIVSLNSPSAK